MAHQNLKRLEGHPGTEQFTCEGMPQTMQRVPLSHEVSFSEAVSEAGSGGCIAHVHLAAGVEQVFRPGLSHFHPFPQCPVSIVAHVDNPPVSGFCAQVYGHGAFPEVDVLKLNGKQFGNTHAGS